MLLGRLIIILESSGQHRYAISHENRGVRIRCVRVLAPLEDRVIIKHLFHRLLGHYRLRCEAKCIDMVSLVLADELGHGVKL